VKDSGPSGCLRHVHAAAITLPAWPAGGDRGAGPGATQAGLAGGEDNAAPSRGPEDRRDGADSRALAIAATGVSGKAKTTRPWLNSARPRASLCGPPSDGRPSGAIG